jgi:hypothetical protein
MEKRIVEFDKYLDSLKEELKLDKGLKEEICSELMQNLYDKHNELMIKGYGVDEGIRLTLNCFEEPKTLAGTFNSVHGQRGYFYRFVRILRNSRVPAIAAAVAMTVFLVI